MIPTADAHTYVLKGRRRELSWDESGGGGGSMNWEMSIGKTKRGIFYEQVHMYFSSPNKLSKDFPERSCFGRTLILGL